MKCPYPMPLRLRLKRARLGGSHYPKSLETAQIELEEVSRCGFPGCSLVYTESLGWTVTCPLTEGADYRPAKGGTT